MSREHSSSGSSSASKELVRHQDPSASRTRRHSWTAGASVIRRLDRGPTVLILLALAFGLWRLDVAPPLFWDEGWTLMVARTWVEQGHYGRLLAGQPAAAGLSAAPPVVASVALSFRLLGVGIWQGRVVIVLYTLGTLLLLYDLARRLYNRRIATATLAVAVLMIALLDIHPLFVGRMVMAETPMLFFLLAGYACFLLTLQRSAWFMPLAVLCWGIGLYTKAQPQPFWIASLAIPLLILLLRRQWKAASLLGIGLIGSLEARRLLAQLWQSWLPREAQRGYAMPGLVRTVAIVSVGRVRLFALAVALIFGGPTLLGLGNAAWRSIRRRREGTSSTATVRWALLILVGSWFTWYVLLSVSWTRYLFPATFLGSVFVAGLLHDLTDGFDLSSTIKHAGHALRHLRFNRHAVRALLAVVLVSLMVPLTLRMLGSFYLTDMNTSVQKVADFLNTRTAPNALIEAYSSELFFLLDRSYHYPPDEVSVQIVRRLFWGQDAPIEYDPLSADPDYLVVCRLYESWGNAPLFTTGAVYDAVLESGAFRLLRVIEPYEIYERVR
jgi:4-amino-4-deoxy-L-arabinose transferase-like glycosyltransferase